MRRPPVKRYALARPAAGRPRPEEGVRRLRLVRMEEIAEQEREKRGRSPFLHRRAGS